MNGFRREVTDEKDIRLNQGVVEDYADELSYHRHLTPGMFVPFATAAHGTAGQSSGLGKWPTIDYPDAVSSYAVCSIRRPDGWKNGNLKITVLYTSQTASASNFTILASVNAIPAGGNMSNTGIRSLGVATLTAPGPSAADGEQNVSFFTSTNPLLGDLARIGVRVGRDGAGDANGSVLQVVDVYVDFMPVKGH